MQVSLKRLGLAGAAVTASLALTPGLASAAVTATNITSPSDPSYHMPNDGTDVDVAIAGVATLVSPGNDPSDNDVDVYCYSNGGRSYVDTLEVDLVNRTFGDPDVTLPTGCSGVGRLRAVPNDDDPDTGYDESIPTGSGLNAFRGPVIAVGEVDPVTLGEEFSGITNLLRIDALGLNQATDLADFFVETAQTRGSWEFESLDNGVESNQLIQGTNFLEVADELFDGVAQLDEDVDDSGAPGMAVDGKRALSTDQVDDLTGLAWGFSPLQAIARNLSASSGDFSWGTSQTLRSCADLHNDDQESPDFDSFERGGLFSLFCSNMLDTGIRNSRNYSTSADGRRLTITDTFTNTSGASHLVELAYENNIEDGSGDPRYGVGNGPLQLDDEYGTLSFAGAPANIVIDSGSDAPDGDQDESTGVISYATVPDVTYFDDDDELIAEYTRTIPAGGSIQIVQTLTQAHSLQEAKELAGIGAAAPAGSSSQPTNTVTQQTIRETVTNPASAGAVQQQSSNARSCTVPRLRGRARLSAERALVRAGCAVGKVSRRSSRKMKAGKVLSQSRSAGSTVAAGTKVDLSVAKKAARRARRG